MIDGNAFQMPGQYGPMAGGTFNPGSVFGVNFGGQQQPGRESKTIMDDPMQLLLGMFGNNPQMLMGLLPQMLGRGGGNMLGKLGGGGLASLIGKL